MISKHPIFSGRVRRISPGFGWVDHRLVSPRRGGGCFGSTHNPIVIVKARNS